MRKKRTENKEKISARIFLLGSVVLVTMSLIGYKAYVAHKQNRPTNIIPPPSSAPPPSQSPNSVPDPSEKAISELGIKFKQTPELLKQELIMTDVKANNAVGKATLLSTKELAESTSGCDLTTYPGDSLVFLHRYEGQHKGNEKLHSHGKIVQFPSFHIIYDVGHQSCIHPKDDSSATRMIYQKALTAVLDSLATAEEIKP